MAGSKKTEGGKDSREVREDDRKEKKAKESQSSQSDLSDFAEMIKRRSQSTATSRKRRTDSSSDSDAEESRFKTPARKRKSSSSPGGAPKKEKKDKKDEVSDGSGDEIHKRSKEMLKSRKVLDFEATEEMKKEITRLRKKLKGDIKQQTIKISMDLDRKNKELVNENLKLRTESVSGKKVNEVDAKKLSEIDAKYRKTRQERDKAEEKLEDVKKTLERVRGQRNKAEEKEDKAKKETTTLIKELREVREEFKKKEKEVLALKEVLQSIIEDGENDVAEGLTEKGNDVTEDASNGKENKPNEAEKGEDSNATVLSSKLDSDDKVDKAVVTKDSKGDEAVDLTKDKIGVGNDGKGSATVPKTLGSSSTKSPASGEATSSMTKPKKDRKPTVYKEDIIEEMSSGDDWEGTTYFKVGNHLVKNVKDAKESIAVGAKMPMKIVKETKRFTATSLNNRLIFIATNAHSKSEHNPVKGDSVCGLSPVCTRRWKEGEPIANVLIFESNWHPSNETQQWVCSHHHDASLHGMNLQIQKLCTKNNKPNSNTKQKKDLVDPFKGLDDFKNGTKSSKDVKK